MYNDYTYHTQWAQNRIAVMLYITRFSNKYTQVSVHTNNTAVLCCHSRSILDYLLKINIIQMEKTWSKTNWKSTRNTMTSHPLGNRQDLFENQQPLSQRKASVHFLFPLRCDGNDVSVPPHPHGPIGTTFRYLLQGRQRTASIVHKDDLNIHQRDRFIVAMDNHWLSKTVLYSVFLERGVPVYQLLLGQTANHSCVAQRTMWLLMCHMHLRCISIATIENACRKHKHWKSERANLPLNLFLLSF